MSGTFTKEQWADIRRQSMATIEGVGLVTAERLPSVLLSYQGQAVGLLNSAGTNVLVIERAAVSASPGGWAPMPC